MAPPSWAYQVEYFITPPDEEMICSICRCVFCEPMECQCQHVFCKNCITRWLNVHRNCPICRKRTSESQLRPVIPLLNNTIMKLTLNCHNKETGCEAVFSLEACESHLRECLYELVECSLGCGKLVFRKDIANHKLTECPFRFTKCDSCKLKVYGQWEDHDCIKALQLVAQDLEKERDKLKKELESLKTKVKELTKELDKQKSHSTNRHDSDRYRSSSRSGSSYYNNPIVMLHSDTDSSDSDDISAYIDDDAADGSGSPGYGEDINADTSENDGSRSPGYGEDINADTSENDGHQEEANDLNRDDAGEHMSIVQSVNRILQSLSDTHQNMESMLNNVGTGESSYNLDSEEGEYVPECIPPERRHLYEEMNRENDHEAEQDLLEHERHGDGEEEDKPLSAAAAPPESIVIDSSSSEDSDGGRAAASSRRNSRKRRLGSPTLLSSNFDGDGGNRLTRRSSSNECSNDEADLNIINDNVAAYAMCCTTEQEAIPSTSSEIVAGDYSHAAKGRIKKTAKSLFCSNDKKEKKQTNCKAKIRGKRVVGSDILMSQIETFFQRVFEGTLSLPEQHSIDSDPEWKPLTLTYYSSSFSHSSSDGTRSSNSCSLLDFLRSTDSSLSEVAKTDSSYKLPSTFDLMSSFSLGTSKDFEVWSLLIGHKKRVPVEKKKKKKPSYLEQIMENRRREGVVVGAEDSGRLHVKEVLEQFPQLSHLLWTEVSHEFFQDFWLWKTDLRTAIVVMTISANIHGDDETRAAVEKVRNDSLSCRVLNIEKKLVVLSQFESTDPPYDPIIFNTMSDRINAPMYVLGTNPEIVPISIANNLNILDVHTFDGLDNEKSLLNAIVAFL